jgi:hypothetical protein
LKKSEARTCIKKLRTEFELLFTPEILEDKWEKSNWLSEAARLSADAFGTQDRLYKRITKAQDLSEEYELEKSEEKKTVLGREWYRTVESWLERTSANIEYGTDFDKTEIQNTKWFVLLYPLLLAFLVAFINYLYSQILSNAEQRFLRQQIENENRKELASVLAEFEFWAKGVQVGMADSIEAIAADFASRGLYSSGLYIKAVHNWALKKRFSIDSARTSYFVRISALGGDTTTLNAPRKLGVRADRSLEGLAKRLNINISHLRLDTL